MSYKWLMFSDIPNLAFVIGYTNASWTLKCELVCQYVCRLLNYIARHGYAQRMSRRDPVVTESMLDFTSGYTKRPSFDAAFCCPLWLCQSALLAGCPLVGLSSHLVFSLF